MSNHTDPIGQATDAFTKFWTDAMSRMGPGASDMFGTPQNDVAKHMRRSFFDAWEHHCEDYMKSDAFLDAMKKSMDQSLTFREQMNQFFATTLRNYHMPSQDDTDSILLAVRRLEERVLRRVDDLAQRVDRIETRPSEGSTSGSANKRVTKGATK